MHVQVIIPIYHPKQQFVRCLRALHQQKDVNLSVMLIDSGSEQSQWMPEAEQLHAEIIPIRAAEFNHGGTRQMGIERSSVADVYVFLTQDAIPATEQSIARLVSVFADPKVGCAYGRQLPHEDANIFASHARAFNYPDKSRVLSFTDRKNYGMKTAFSSNSFSAYRRTALVDVGGFPTHTILSEDMYVVARMLQAGWKSAYVAEAAVYHSHNYTFMQEFHRYFDIGVFHHREGWIRETFGQAEGEGGRFVADEIRLLMHRAPWLLPEMLVRDGMKFLGYRLGIMESRLPVTWKRKLAMNKTFF